MEHTLFRNAVGNTPKIRVLEYMIENGELDCSLSDIAEGAEVGRTTLFRLWKDLVDADMVVHTRNIGNAKLFKSF